MAKKTPKKQKSKNRSGKIAVTFMVIAMAGILSIQIVRLYNKNESYQEQKAELEAELEDAQNYATELEDEETYIGSDEYVEDVARSKLGMVYNDEIVFKEQ